MTHLFVVLLILHAVAYVTCDGEACSDVKEWSTQTTKYVNIRHKADLYVHTICKRADLQVDGAHTILCVNGQPEKPLPECKIANRGCVPLPVPAYGSKWCSPTSPEVGSVCKFECKATHFRRGSGERTCSQELRWTGSQPLCLHRPQCPIHPHVSNPGVIVNCSSTRVPKYNDICSFRCREGFELVGPSHLTCRLNGKLTDEKGVEHFPRCHVINSPCTGSRCQHFCRPDSGIAVCYCAQGFRLLEDGTTCVDVDECRSGEDHCQHTCQNTIGSYVCSCRRGFKLIDRNHCEAQQPDYEREVFGHFPTNRRTFQPSPRDSCQFRNGDCDHSCQEEHGRVKCRCHAGFELEQDGKKCRRIFSVTPTSATHLSTMRPEVTGHQDSYGRREESPSYNPCAYKNGFCDHDCHLLESGRVQCDCWKGFRLLQDSRTCADVDECADLRLNKCDHLCHNTAGGYRCSCKPGYVSLDEFKCEEIISIAPTFPTHISTVHPKVTGHQEPDGRRNQPSFFNPCEWYNGYCAHYCRSESGSIQCECRKGYKLLQDSRSCEDIDECSNGNNGCSHLCFNQPGSAVCSCPGGFKLQRNRKTCADVDECADSSLNKCDHLCHNTAGSYRCSCSPGYVSLDEFKCEGCRMHSYKSSSENSCIDCPPHSHTEAEAKNSIGDCKCDSGFYGNPALNIPCKDIDECATGNFGCSHLCENMEGSARCTCPSGFELKGDQKTCVDIDECRTKNGGCDGLCENTPGGFNCICKEGYVPSSKDKYSCEDIDECSINNGNCSEVCVNFQGGYHCACREGHHLHPDGQTCIVIYCPNVYVPHHSTLRCRDSPGSEKIVYQPGMVPENKEFPVGARCTVKCNKGYELESSSHSTIVCLSDAHWNASLPKCEVLQCPALIPPENGEVYPASCKEGSMTVKEKCIFTCLPGYRIIGQEVFMCMNKLEWDIKNSTSCVPETDPSISCPDDVTIELMANKTFAKIILESPTTNVDFIHIHPNWVSLGNATFFPAGETKVTFTVSRPSDKTAQCFLNVWVVDKEPPVFYNCPDIIHVSGSGLQDTVVDWDEPVAVDNIGILTVSKSLEPNSTLPPGIHTVEYIARDIAGNIDKCSFEINVTLVDGCIDLEDPENGEANCMEWMFGKICQPICHLNYTRAPGEPEFLACDESGVWLPSDYISPCLPECPLDEIWFPELQECRRNATVP